MKKNFYKHIIFDWNGTILDDSEINYELTMLEFDECGIKRIDYDEFKKNLIFPLIDFLKKYGFDGNMPQYLELCKLYQEKYMEKLPEISLYSDAKETLSFLKEHDVSLYILSAFKQDLLIDCVERFGIYQYFDEVLGLKKGDGGSKVENALNFFNADKFKKEELLMIGDTVHDAEVAKALGIDCILVSCGYQYKDTLQKTGYKVFDSLSEVIEYFKKECYIL